MLCSDTPMLFELMLDGHLSTDRKAEVERHLTTCEECMTRWRELKVVHDRSQEFKNKIPVPTDLSKKVGGSIHPDILSPNDSLQLIDSMKELSIQKPQPEPAKQGSFFRPRTIICERHDLIRFGLKRVVSEVVEVVGEAADGMSAMDMVKQLKPDFIILDVDLDVLNGVEVCRRLAEGWPHINVLVLTDSYHATKYHNQLTRAGAKGFCLKSSGPRTMFQAIEQVTRGLPFADPNIVQLIKQTPATALPNSNLTDREIEVLIRLDLRNKEIAEELDMKLRTVEKHIECILAKLKVPTRTAAALKAVQLGYTLLPKMPGRDPVTGVSHEQTVAELQAELSLANEHLKALMRQNELLRNAWSGAQ